MKRVAVITAVLTAAAIVAILGTGAGGEGGTYKVRAIFDNAVSVIPGEDVKIAGVKVGKIAALDVTPDKKAAVTLDITEKGFQDFRDDATCTIRPQSLIGEKFVECTPTQPRAVGEAQAPALREIKRGDGKGEHLLPVSQTSSPVDIDLINNILRRPYAERLTILLNEFGTGVAGQGKNLDLTIKRSNPAFRELDKVLAILAKQNKILDNLTTDSDTILAPLARERQAVADQFTQSAEVASATAERGDALEANFEKLPEFLRQLRPTMVRLGALADQATPVFTDLGAQADNINTLIEQLGPFSEASLPAFRTLGQAAEIGGPALTKSDPTIQEIGKFAKAAKPLSKNAAALLDSFQKAGGVEHLMDYIFLQVAAVNGFDQLGHYLRAGVIVNLCSTYATQPAPGCSANFTGGSGASSKLTASQVGQLRANAAQLAGNVPVIKGTRTKGKAKAGKGAIGLPKIALPGRLGELLSGTGVGVGKKTTPSAGGGSQQQGQKVTPQSVANPLGAQAQTQAPDPRQGLLDYLLGGSS